jgi:hypothetical protein
MKIGFPLFNGLEEYNLSYSITSHIDNGKSEF